MYTDTLGLSSNTISHEQRFYMDDTCILKWIKLKEAN